VTTEISRGGRGKGRTRFPKKNQGVVNLVTVENTVEPGTRKGGKKRKKNVKQTTGRAHGRGWGDNGSRVQGVRSPVAGPPEGGKQRKRCKKL